MNKKKIAILIFLLSLFTFLSIGMVYAGPGESIGKALESTVGWIKLDLSDIGGPSSSTFYARFLIWIFLFAALYFAAGYIFQGKRNIQLAVAAVLAIIGAAVIPGTVLQGIFRSYFLFFSIVLFLLPIIAVFFLSHKIKEMEAFKNKPAAGHLLSGVAFLVTLVVMSTLNETMKGQIPQKVIDLQMWFDLAVGICTIMLIWHVAAVFFGFGRTIARGTGKGITTAAEDVYDTRRALGEAAQASKEEGGALNQARRGLRNLWQGVAGERRLETRELKNLAKVNRMLGKTAGTGGRAQFNRDKREILRLLAQTQGLNERARLVALEIENLANVVERIDAEDDPQREQRERRLKHIGARILLIFGKDGIKRHIKNAQRLVRGDNYKNARKEVSDAVLLDEEAVKLTTELAKISRQVEDLIIREERE